MNNLKVEHENLVAKWLQNSFKIQETAALDLRATPLSLQIPMAEVNNRPVFKMNNDFWNQARGPPQSMAQNLTSSNQNSPVPTGPQNSIPAHSPSQQSNSSQNHVITQGALALQNSQQTQQQQQQAQQQQQQAQQQQAQQQQAQQQMQNAQQHAQTNQQTSTQPNNQLNQNQNNVQQNNTNQPQLDSPNSHVQAQAHVHAQALVQAQQQQLVQMQQQQQQQISSGQNSPDVMAKKFVDELQVRIQIHFSFALFEC